MLKSEIIERLNTSNRWGTNDQPGKAITAGFLQHLPIDYLCMDGEATLYIRLSRPLRHREWMILGYLRADAPNWDEVHSDQTEFQLWWD